MKNGEQVKKLEVGAFEKIERFIFCRRLYQKCHYKVTFIARYPDIFGIKNSKKSRGYFQLYILYIIYIKYIFRAQTLGHERFAQEKGWNLEGNAGRRSERRQGLRKGSVVQVGCARIAKAKRLVNGKSRAELTRENEQNKTLKMGINLGQAL